MKNSSKALDPQSRQAILIIDDTPANLEVLGDYLAQSGFKVMGARDGEAGLQLARQDHPDLILLDIMLPGLNGFEVCRRLKEDGQTREIPVIFTTILDRVEDKIKGFEVGGVDYITKPYQETEILARVTTHLRLRELNDRLEQKVRKRTEELTRVNQQLRLEISERRLAEENLQKAHDNLEEQVRERTVELKAAKEAAESANAAKSVFLARMSHEIRTPLNAVIGLTSIVLKSELEDEQRDYLNKVKVAGGNLLHVINDILDFSKVEAGRLELERNPFDLDQLLEQLADLFSDQLIGKDVELIFSAAPQVPRQLFGDAARLTQVLTNLIQNAVKFTESGEIAVRVELEEQIRLKQKEIPLRFLISDTGIGVAAESMSTLFEPFTQVEDYLGRQHEGSGLGLAICRSLVDLMGGSIRLLDTSDRGSIFCFSITLEREKQDLATEKVLEDYSGVKALVVDGNVTARQVLHDLLASLQFKVSVTDSSTRAVQELQEAAAAEPFRLVFLDWKMLSAAGINTTETIRNNPNLSDTRIVLMVTAFGQQQVQKRIDSSTVDRLLLKPVKPSQLRNTVHALLGPNTDNSLPGELQPIISQHPRFSNCCVLVVEDSLINREVAQILLESAGIQVQTAENGSEALQKVTAATVSGNHYDAILMDIQMPLVDGYEATRQIRLLETEALSADSRVQARTPIIALTAHALKGEMEKCLTAGMDDYLAKPIDDNELFRVLAKWLPSRLSG